MVRLGWRYLGLWKNQFFGPCAILGCSQPLGRLIFCRSGTYAIGQKIFKKCGMKKNFEKFLEKLLSFPEIYFGHAGTISRSSVNRGGGSTWVYTFFGPKKFDFSFLSVLMVPECSKSAYGQLRSISFRKWKNFIFRPFLKILWSWMLTSLLHESPFWPAGSALRDLKMGYRPKNRNF